MAIHGARNRRNNVMNITAKNIYYMYDRFTKSFNVGCHQRKYITVYVADDVDPLLKYTTSFSDFFCSLYFLALSVLHSGYMHLHNKQIFSGCTQGSQTNRSLYLFAAFFFLLRKTHTIHIFFGIKLTNQIKNSDQLHLRVC